MNKKSKDYIIFPLDFPNFAAAEPFIDCLTDVVGMFKVGLELFIEEGPLVIRKINAKSPAGIFLDLKLHDIPATVQRAVRRIADLGVALTTVHCGESSQMLRAAVEAAQGKTGILGVTVLTSVATSDIKLAGFAAPYSQNMEELVLHRAQMAQKAGCAGIVCSGQEVKRIKQLMGESFCTVTPGIRPDWEDKGGDDQKRVTTPREAVLNGADYLVIGRPIRDADDPRQAAIQIAAEIDDSD